MDNKSNTTPHKILLDVNSENLELIGVIKYMKGSDIDDIELKNKKGIKDTDYVKLVVKVNTPRRKDVEKSYGRVFDLINSL
jgi:hypothetical protein